MCCIQRIRARNASLIYFVSSMSINHQDCFRGGIQDLIWTKTSLFTFSWPCQWSLLFRTQQNALWHNTGGFLPPGTLAFSTVLNWVKLYNKVTLDPANNKFRVKGTREPKANWVLYKETTCETVWLASQTWQVKQSICPERTSADCCWVTSTPEQAECN